MLILLPTLRIKMRVVETNCPVRLRWYDGGSSTIGDHAPSSGVLGPCNAFTEKVHMQKLDYMYNNRVKKELVDSPDQWQFPTLLTE